MNFLDKLVIPQSLENLILLKYILTLALILFIPFIGLLLISSVVSWTYSMIGRKEGNEIYLRFAKEIIDIITSSKNIVVILGIVPAITIILAYTQLLHASKIFVDGYLIIALLILIGAIIYLFSYRYTFHLDEIFKFARSGVKGETGLVQLRESEEIAQFTKSNLKTNMKSGIYGVSLLVISTYIFISCIHMVYDTEKWTEENSIFTIVFSLKAITKYIYFLLASVAFSSGAALFYFFRFKNAEEYDRMYLNFLRKISVVSGIITVAALPLFVIINLIMTPRSAVSASLFTLTALGLILLFVIIHLYYVLTRQWSTVYSAYIFYLLIVFIAVSVINDQTAFSYSTKKQEMVLAANYNMIVAQAEEKAGRGPAISGKEIFDGRCAACHRFDIKLVGPAYKDVLPKYEGNREQLVAFIANPVKKDPAFPPMPNQGLKPKEVEAVADYIMATYKEGGK